MNPQGQSVLLIQVQVEQPTAEIYGVHGASSNAV
jgi:hypothetical protein